MSQCRFCTSPLARRRNAVTCGSAPCKRKQHNHLQRVYRAANRQGPTSCIVCGTSITAFSICSDACRRERKRQRGKAYDAKNRPAHKPKPLKPCIVCGQLVKYKLCSAKCREIRKAQYKTQYKSRYKSQNKKTSPRKTPPTKKVRVNEIKEKNKILGPAKVAAWHEYQAALLAEHPELRGEKHRKLLMYKPTEPHLLDLWHAYTAARNRLVENNINLARKLSTKYPDPDSYSICLEALIRAADKFNPEQAEFSTYATMWARSFIGNYLSKAKVSIPSHLVAAVKSLNKFVAAWEAKYARPPTHKEIISNFQLAVPMYNKDKLAYIKKLIDVENISICGEEPLPRVEDTPTLHEDLLAADLTPEQLELACLLLAGEELDGPEVEGLRAALRGP